MCFTASRFTKGAQLQRRSCRGGVSQGFTMIELMVVIAIIAVLAAILFPVFNRSRESARQAACRGNLHAIAMALRNYCTDEGSYPPPYDAVYGLGGVTQLYLSGYLGSVKVLRCPDDGTTLEEYISANGISTGSWPGNRWARSANGGRYFTDHYSSYNQYFPAAAGGALLAYPTYNYFGYRGYAGFAGVGTGVGSVAAAPLATGPSIAELMTNFGLVPVPGPGWPGIDYDTWSANDSTNYNQLLIAARAWSAAVYTDANHLPLYDPTSQRLFDRPPYLPGPTPDPYARPLWDRTADNITAYYPGLVNRNAPDYTMITHCPWHRVWFAEGNDLGKDLVVRLSGDTEWVSVNSYDWVVQKSD